MLIFDRWGGLVFETDDIREGWNGGVNNQGPTVQTGIYTYKVTLVSKTSSEKKSYQGSVTLLR